MLCYPCFGYLWDAVVCNAPTVCVCECVFYDISSFKEYSHASWLPHSQLHQNVPHLDSLWVSTDYTLLATMWDTEDVLPFFLLRCHIWRHVMSISLSQVTLNTPKLAFSFCGWDTVAEQRKKVTERRNRKTQWLSVSFVLDSSLLLINSAKVRPMHATHRLGSTQLAPKS
jgi:hypothetical protein